MKKLDKINDILLRRRNAVYLHSINVEKVVKEKHIKALMADIAQLGYTLSGSVLTILKTYDKHNLKNFHIMLIESLSIMVGSKFNYVPLFKGFPDNVPDQDEYLNERIFGYVENIFKIKPELYKILSCGHIINEDIFNLKMFGACPICQFQVNDIEMNKNIQRLELKDITPLTVIDIVDKDEIFSIYKNLLISPVSLNDQDYIDLETIIVNSNKDKIKGNTPNISVKEILSKFVLMVMNNFSEIEVVEFLSDKQLTATDILRIAVSMSNGDVSLSKNTKFKTFSNKDRRLLLGLLDNVKNPEEDMKKYIGNWKRLGEKLHPGSYSDKYVNAFNSFNMIRNNPKEIKTFASSYEEALTKKDYILASRILANRPGEFIRRFDNILRNVNEKDAFFLLNTFKEVIKSIKTVLLLQVEAHFSHRDQEIDQRYFMPKGNMAKIKVFDSTYNLVSAYKPIDKETVKKISKIIFDEIQERFYAEAPLNKVFIDPALKECLIPTVRRNASKSLHSVARGSKLSFNNKKARTVRLFIYWKGYVDLDLSVVCYDKDWNIVTRVSFRDLNQEEFGIVHSGDIQSAPNGATEFIDFDIDKCKNKNVKYVVMSVLSFSGQDFSEFESFAGAMTKETANSGELYEPKTVEHRFEFEGEGSIAIPLIFDIEEEKITFTDLITKGHLFSTIESNGDSIKLIAKSIFDFVKTKPNLYTLFELHAKSRGAVIDNILEYNTDYDFIFGLENLEKSITPYDIDKINGEWLGA